MPIRPWAVLSSEPIPCTSPPFGDLNGARDLLDRAERGVYGAGRPARRASRLRGAHDRTDRQVRDLTRRGRTALGEEAFAAAYGKGWELDRKTAVSETGPARLPRNT